MYLPPAWFAANAPKLPVVMMIAGEFNTPSDWPRTGDAIAPIDKFAAAHGGNAPVFVFVDVGGSFNNDTECVNGPRGNVADHLTKDVPPYVVKHFRRQQRQLGGRGLVDGRNVRGGPDRDASGVVQHLRRHRRGHGPECGNQGADHRPDLRRRRLQRGPIYDPTTVINKHGPYKGVSGWFAISSDAPTQRKGGYGNPNAVGLGGQDAAGNPGDQTDAANSLCRLGRANGIACAVVATPGKHDWPFAMDVFTSSLPWLAGQIGTPGVPRIPLPGGGAAPGPAGAPLQAATH